MSRCRWMNDPEIGRWHLPGCMGAAVYGPDGCTCGATDRNNDLESRIERLETRLAKIEGRYSAPPSIIMEEKRTGE